MQRTQQGGINSSPHLKRKLKANFQNKNLELLYRIFHSEEIVTVEEDPRNVTEDEDKDDADENKSKVDLTPHCVLGSLVRISETLNTKSIKL